MAPRTGSILLAKRAYQKWEMHGQDATKSNKKEENRRKWKETRDAQNGGVPEGARCTWCLPGSRKSGLVMGQAPMVLMVDVRNKCFGKGGRDVAGTMSEIKFQIL